MSRTYRRKGTKNPWPYEPWISWNGTLKHWGHHDWEYHSDKYRWRGNCYSITKEHTDRQRRCDERIALHHLAKDPEYDYYDREKAYDGIIWMYD